MPLPTINASNPVSTPAVPAQDFNQWVMTLLHIDATDAAHSKYQVNVNLGLVAVNPDGSYNFNQSADQAQLSISDLYAQAASDTTQIPTVDANGNPVQLTLAGIMAAIVGYTIAYGAAQRKL